MSDYKIIPLKSDKDNIEQPEAVKNNVIPRFASSILLIGRSGSGKSILCQNLIFDERFYGGFFDEVFLISPTAKSDSIQKQFNIPDSNIIDDLEIAPEKINSLMEFQRKSIVKNGVEKSLKLCFIFDDVIGDPKFMRTDILTKLFIACRHFNIHCVVCSQSYKSVPKRMRLQALMICLFPSSNNEIESICEDYCPNHHSKKEFFKIVKYATNEPYNFLTILNTVQMKDRYRKNLDTIISLKNK